MTADVTEKGDAARDGPPDIKLSPAGDEKADSSDKEADGADKEADRADKEPASSGSAKKEVRVELDKEKTGDSLLDSKGKINMS